MPGAGTLLKIVPLKLPINVLVVILPIKLPFAVLFKLPTFALPLTLTLVNVPTLVIFGWLAVVTVPAITAEFAVFANSLYAAKFALATIPFTFGP